MKTKWINFVILVGLLLFASSCIDNPINKNNRQGSNNGTTLSDPEVKTRFVSARGGIHVQTNDDDVFEAERNVTNNGGGFQEIYEGDIYQVSSDGLILNLDKYKGLQIIDFSDPARPKILGQTNLSGTRRNAPNW